MEIRRTSFKCLLLTGFALLLAGCVTTRDDSAFDFQMPETFAESRAATSAAAPAPAAAEPAVETEAPRRGLFGRRNRDEDAEPAGDAAPMAAAPSVAPAAAPPAAPQTVAAVPPAQPHSAYTLQVDDPLIITLSGPNLEERIETTVDERGFVKLRFIGSVRAAGRTATELEREIEAEYTDRQRIYREIYVRVQVPNNFYFIGGEVRSPGRFPLIGRVTLTQAVVADGNFTEWARRDGRLILVRNNERSTIVFRDIVSDPSLDIELRPGDVITVERSTF